MREQKRLFMPWRPFAFSVVGATACFCFAVAVQNLVAGPFHQVPFHVAFWQVYFFRVGPSFILVVLGGLLTYGAWDIWHSKAPCPLAGAAVPSHRSIPKLIVAVLVSFAVIVAGSLLVAALLVGSPVDALLEISSKVTPVPTVTTTPTPR